LKGEVNELGQGQTGTIQKKLGEPRKRGWGDTRERGIRHGGVKKGRN